MNSTAIFVAHFQIQELFEKFIYTLHLIQKVLLDAGRCVDLGYLLIAAAKFSIYFLQDHHVLTRAYVGIHNCTVLLHALKAIYPMEVVPRFRVVSAYKVLTRELTSAQNVLDKERANAVIALRHVG